MRTKIGQGGRIVIPVAFRRELGVCEGDTLFMQVVDGAVHIYTPGQAVKRAHEIMKPCIVPGESLVDELIADRRAEAARE